MAILVLISDPHYYCNIQSVLLCRIPQSKNKVSLWLFALLELNCTSNVSLCSVQLTMYLTYLLSLKQPWYLDYILAMEQLYC